MRLIKLYSLTPQRVASGQESKPSVGLQCSAGHRSNLEARKAGATRPLGPGSAGEQPVGPALSRREGLLSGFDRPGQVPETR